MKLLLRLSLVCMLAVAGLVAVGFLLPRTYRVERSITVAAPPDRVFALVGDLARWPDWAVWFARDPELQLERSPEPAAAGAWMQWRSRSQGNGRLEVTGHAPPELLRYRLTFEGLPFASTGTLRLVSAPGGGGTVVTWSDEGDLGWSPLARWFGRLLDRLVGPDLAAGLARLQAVAEGRPAPPVSPPGG